MEEKIPVINMQEKEHSSKAIKEACEKWGCFRVINHGVPLKLTAEIKSVAAELFDRPVEIKRNNKEIIPGSGYKGPSESSPVYEVLALDFTSSASLPSFFDQLHASPMQRETIEKYTQAIHDLGNEIVSKMLDGDDAKVRVTHFRMNKYNITHDRVGSYGLSLHTDASLITILQDDDSLGGLEVVNPSGDIVLVDRLPGSLIVNLGEVAVPWSNGTFRNVPHRVVCKETGIRLSIATIITPSIEENIQVHPKFIEGGRPPKYIPFKFEELRRLRASDKSYCGEVLELFLCKN
ncbi:hypothetical protein vseg_015598 [Gypsophila vaccaria]